MLLLNGEQFIPSGKNPNHELQIAHYEEAIADIRERYGQGGRNSTIVLTRRKEQKRNASGMLEETAPMIFPATAYPEIQLASKHVSRTENVGGMETWSYSEHRPTRKNPGDPFEPDPKSIKFMSYFETFDMNTQMDLIYFLLYKSPRVYYPPAIAQGKVKKGDLMVKDKALEAKEKVQKQRDELRLKNAIMAPDAQYPLHSDENLRKVAAAWGIDGAMDKYVGADDIRLKLEEAVKQGEQKKKSSGKGKGFDEFFDLINFDDSVRQRSLIMYALDNNKLTHDEKSGVYAYAGGDQLVSVPPNKKYHAFDYLAEYLGNDMNESTWSMFLREIVDAEYLDTLNFGDLKWLAKLNELPVSQKSTEALREDLCKVYCG